MEQEDKSTFQKSVEALGQLGTGKIEDSRGHDLNAVMIDVNSRANEQGKQDTLILVYVRPDIDPKKIYKPLIKTCKRLFGEKMDTRFFETSYIPGNSVELSTGERNDFNCFDIRIKFPKSALYGVKHMKGVFPTELKRHLKGIY